MHSALPSKNSKLLKDFLGKKIKSVKRQLFKGDMDLPDFEQNADGPLELIFSDDTSVHFSAYTEAFSICIFPGNMPVYGSSFELRDVSRNFFWIDKVDQKINGVSIFRSPDWSDLHPSEFGIEICFLNKQKVVIEYKDEEDYPDMMTISSRTLDRHRVLQQFNLNN